MLVTAVDRPQSESRLEWVMRNILIVICGLAIGAPVAAQQRGLAATADALGGPRWQARFEKDFPLLSLSQGRTAPLLGSMPGTLRLLGDYQFRTFRLGDTGGLRLTGGVLLNLRETAPTDISGDGRSALSYSGIGYAGVGYAAGSSSGGWGFSADLGLAGPRFGGTNQDRGTPGGLSVDSSGTRDFRLQPMIRLGVSVTF